jgi:hypothetical protein
MLRPLEQWLDEDLCIEPRYTDPPKQKLLHAADVLCIDYYAACQRKKRANRWNNCHPQVGRSRQQAQKKNLLGFRVRAFGISNLASGRGGPRYCGGQPSGLKNGLSSPRERGPEVRPVCLDER